ncbi:MAG: phage portal protein [Rhizomicrobium sp.]
MGYWSRILGSEGDGSQDRYVDDWLKGLDDGGLISSSGVRVTPEEAMTVPGISACTNVLAEDLAKVPCILYKRGDDREHAVDHPLYKLLKYGPAPWLSSYQWRRVLIANALTRGNGYSRVRRDDSARLSRLTLIQPGSINHKWQTDGEPFFDFAQNGQLQQNLSWQDIIHVAYRATTDGCANGGVIGISPIVRNKETVALAIAAERFAGRFFKNGAKPSAILEMDKKLPDDEVAKRIRAGIERVYGGVENSFKIAILEMGIKLKEWSFDPQKSQMTETRKEQAVQCCSMYGVPPHKIGILDRATFSNIEQQGIDYVTGPVSALAQNVESAIEIACLTPSEREMYYVECNLDALMRGDLESRYRAYAIGRQWGWLSADDALELENRKRLPNGQGQTYLTPSNMMPADTVDQSRRGQQRPPAPPAKDGQD